MTDEEESDRTRLVLLEYRTTQLEKSLADRDSRERWIAGTVIALAAVIVSVVLPLVLAHP